MTLKYGQVLENITSRSCNNTCYVINLSLHYARLDVSVVTYLHSLMETVFGVTQF
jgi:ribulose-5-phosphate 4-epimerase/fuculose-1-phosphate aldolase